MNKQVIYMDLDGVIANFNRLYKTLFNRNPENDDHFTGRQFCMQEPRFFRMLPIIPEGMELFNMLRNDYDIVFLSTPMAGMEYCRRDKILWVQENLGEYDVVFSDNKSEFVIDETSILIDDMDYNLEPWRAAGGTAILFPQKLDKILNTIDNVFNPDQEIKTVKSQLKKLSVNLNPTEAQKRSGIYKKGNVDMKGLKIKIENPRGSIRWGFDESGRKWVNRMKHHYGYITGSEGSDYDPIDCFVGPHPNKSLVFVVNQGRDNMFYEHKVMLGFDTMEDAKKGYLSNYKSDWSGLMTIVQTNTKKLRDWLRSGNLKEPFYP